MLLIWIKEFIKFMFKGGNIKTMGRMKVEACHGTEHRFKGSEGKVRDGCISTCKGWDDLERSLGWSWKDSRAMPRYLDTTLRTKGAMGRHESH